MRLTIKVWLKIIRFVCVLAAVLYFLVLAVGYTKTTQIYTHGGNCTVENRGLQEIPLYHPRVFIAIVSGHSTAARRDSIRSTWLHWAKQNNIPYSFFVGRAQDERDVADLKREQALFSDIVELDSPDTYNTLTLKTIELLKYMDNQVVEYDFLMKVDDDTFVRVDRLINYFMNIPKKRTYLGYFHYNLPTILKEGYKNNEIYYPKEMKELVPFASGSGYGLSSDLVSYIVKNLDVFTKFHNEDVSVGTWLFPLELKRIHEPRLNVGWKCENDAIIVHAVKHQKTMEQMFKNSEDKTTCICEQIKKGEVK